LVRLILSPDTCAKVSRVIMINLRFLGCAVVMIVVSSANYKRVVWADGSSINSWCRLLIMAWRESVTSMNKSGEIGSPCLSPFLW
jgi:hypothetical protein